MARQHNKIYLASLITLAALSASCSGNSAMSNLEPAAATANQSQAALPEHLIGDAPVLPKSSSDLFDFFPDLDLGLDIDWDAFFEALHQPLVEGDNALDMTHYLGASSDVETVSVLTGFHTIPPGIEVPIYEDGLHLASSAGQMSYVTYGFNNIPADEDIIHITAQGGGIFSDHVGDGLYIGVGDYVKGSYRWFGPFSPDSSEWDLPLHNIDNTNDTQHAYVTFAVYGGDEVTLSQIHVEVGAMTWYPKFDWDTFDFSLVIGEDGYSHFPHLPAPDPAPGL